MTPERLAEIEARAAAATEGPWQVDDANEGGPRPFWMVVNDAFLNPPADGEAPWIAVELHTGIEADATFIAHARTDIPDLLAAYREAVARAEAAETVRDLLAVRLNRLDSTPPPRRW